MDVGRIQGHGGVDRGPEPKARADRQDGARATRGVHADSASISDSSHRALARVEELAERLRDEDGSRRSQVDGAARRLRAGELDRPEVYEAVARRLLGDVL
jgi:hypothetical protein